MEREEAVNVSPARYRRQTAFAAIGKEGQRKLEASRVVVVGVGALGSVIAERLVRAGIGHVRLIDRDWVEWDNLPRQTLFMESDARNRLPKAIAAGEHLRAINTSITIEPVVSDLIPSNAIDLLGGFDLLLDGTDNFETRFLINDASLEFHVPWIHGGCVGATGKQWFASLAKPLVFDALCRSQCPPISRQRATRLVLSDRLSRWLVVGKRWRPSSYFPEMLRPPAASW